MATRHPCTLNYGGGTGPYTTLYLNVDNSYSATLYDSPNGGSPVRRILPVKSGSKFLYWAYRKYGIGGRYELISCSGSDGSFYGDGLRDAAKETTTNIYIDAQWEEYTFHTLTLDANGGTAGQTTKQVKCTVPLGTLPTPTWTGHAFGGWYKTKDPVQGETPVTASTEYWQDEDGTIYARWTENPKHTLTLDPNGGTVSTPSVQITEGTPIGQLTEPIYIPNRFLGWYTASTGGTKIEPETTYSWTTNKTFYAHWEAPHTITFNSNGGQPSEILRYVFTGDAIGTLPEVTRSGYFPDGWWTDEEGGEEVTPETIYEATGDTTVYAHWTLDEQWNLTFAANGGTVSPLSKRVRPGQAVGELPTPEYGGREFLGWFTQPYGGVQWDKDTVFDDHQDVTLHAHWYRTEYTLRFNPTGGTVSETERTVTINEPIGELPVPTKYANTFLGWFTARDGGEEWDEDTVFENTDDTTLYAHWETDPQFVRTISLNAEGGTVSPSTVSCTYGLPLDILPIPVNSGNIFLGWFTATTGGNRYSSGTTCDWSGTLTLHAHWTEDVFGNLTDWFGLETADGPLMLVASTDGATRSVTMTSHSGALAIQTADSSVGAFERGGILMNPTCTYRIRKEGTVQINLGKAYGSATITGNGTTSNPYRVAKSGYMLVQAKYATAADGEPVLVIRGAANEGYVWQSNRMVSQLTDAVNKWTINNFPVNPDHIAQDPMGAVSGGGELTDCKTLVTCDPVVPIENGMPCASDIVHGKVVVTATTNAYGGENAPTARLPFIETNGVQPDESDVDFTSYAFQAERSL